MDLFPDILPKKYVAVFVGFVVVFSLWLYSQGPKSKYPLPPGPKGSPVIGNLRQVPAERSDIQFEKWAREFNSDIIYLNLLGQPAIVLNTVELAVDLLDKRGLIYSDRPSFTLLEALGFKNNVAMIGDGARFRKLRKPYGNFLSARNSLEYRESQLKYARVMAIEIENCPGKWQNYLSLFSTRVLFSMAFAIDVVDENDKYAKLAEEMGRVVSNMGNLGLTIIDIAPWVQNVPRWIGRFIPSVKYVHENRPAMEEFHQRPFDAVVENYKAGTSRSSFIGRLMEARENSGADEEGAIEGFTDNEIKGAGGSLYSAGQETTFSTLTIFVMGMVLNSSVQSQAQKEIDAVTEGKRLPSYGDWKALPIVEWIVYESLRFHPSVPIGIPHRTMKEDVYRDMYIPKGSMVIFNSWAMLHNPKVYSDPFKFNPNRYRPVSEGGDGEPFPTGPFGFGRRICPGQFFGIASVWIAVATILAKFNISPPKDKDGKNIMPEQKFTTGISSHPVPFSCVFTPRKA